MAQRVTVPATKPESLSGGGGKQTPASFFSDLPDARACLCTQHTVAHTHARAHTYTHTHCSKELLKGHGEGIEQEGRELRMSRM